MLLRPPALKPASALVLIALSFAAALVSCQHAPSPAARFLEHPEFLAAAQAAPHFTADVLHALADAEARLPQP